MTILPRNTKENVNRLWICEECRAVKTDEEIRKDVTSGKWGYECKAKKFRRETRCEAFHDAYIPEESNDKQT